MTSKCEQVSCYTPLKLCFQQPQQLRCELTIFVSIFMHHCEESVSDSNDYINHSAQSALHAYDVTHDSVVSVVLLFWFSDGHNRCRGYGARRLDDI